MDSSEGVTIVVVATQGKLEAWTAVLTKRQVRVQARRVPAADLYPTNFTFTSRCQIDLPRQLPIFSERTAGMLTPTE
jgi:hypothetical protein